ncbi:hypothetical protein C7G41_10845 [Bradyrhizobium sp. MOS002]|nr:hypothetical protein C7G41_10845 [Bradyrhizobium sp. MOS002]
MPTQGAGARFPPSPLVGEGGAKRRMRGMSPQTRCRDRLRREIPHPSRRKRGEPPSPTRGEG